MQESKGMRGGGCFGRAAGVQGSALDPCFFRETLGYHLAQGNAPALCFGAELGGVMMADLDLQGDSVCSGTAGACTSTASGITLGSRVFDRCHL